MADDFGLTRAGIVFQFNNGDEQTLIVKDFTAEPAKSRTTAALQEMLMLEKLAASPTDSLTYYAFAEDNYPGGAKRTETDLRYLDIRPFKREYKLAETGEPMEGEGELATLAELIARQRFNLNRATRLAKHKPADKTFAEDPLKIAGFEETLAGLTREFTEGVEGIVGQRIEPLHAAEEAMLAAIAALDHGQNRAIAGPHGRCPSPPDRGPRYAPGLDRPGPHREPRRCAASTVCKPKRSASPRRTRKRPRRSPRKSNNSPKMKTSSTQRSPAS